jgi:hypothetical protein
MSVLFGFITFINIITDVDKHLTSLDNAGVLINN